MSHWMQWVLLIAVALFPFVLIYWVGRRFLVLVMVLAASAPDFCAGFRQGFTAAYCAGHQFCRSAPVPPCPESEGSWQDGYERGYSDGERVHQHTGSRA